MHKFESLEIGRQFRYRPKKDWKLPVIALDSETLLNGNTFLICDSLGNYVWKPNLRDCLDFLFLRCHHQKLNFFYNLEFDVRGVIKFLWESEQKKLVTAGKAEIKTGIDKHGKPGCSYTLRYCKDRMYIVKESKGRKTVAFYDLAQFYRPLSLDRAAKMFLGEGKEGIKDYKFTPESTEERKEEIIKYCLRDCTLTAQLGELAKKKYEALGIFEKAYISPAYLSEKYFNKFCRVPKTLGILTDEHTKKINLRIGSPLYHNPVWYAYEAYAGGWIEIQKRGHFENLYKYDINSAYPYVMSNLIDPSKGFWLYAREWLAPEADYAFVKAEVTIDPNRVAGLDRDPVARQVYLSPISYLFTTKGMNLRYYPVGKWTCYLTANEFKFIRDALGERGLGTVKLIDGWFFFAEDFASRPLGRRVRLLYELKTELKGAQKYDKNLVIEYNQVKLLLNSLYGKFIQRVEVKKLDGEEKIYIDHAKTGGFFNPIWAAIITSECRLQIARALLDKESSCAAITTDGILTTEPLDLKLNKELGAWSQEPGGEAVIVLPGAYGIKGQKPESKIRAFKGIFRGDTSKNWFDYLTVHKSDSFIHVRDKRPVSLMEALLHTEKFTTKDINRFVEFERKYNLKEYRRLWYKEIKTCQDLLNKSVDSTPLLISALEARKHKERTRRFIFEKAETLTQRVIKKGGIKLSSAVTDFGKYSELPLCVRRKTGLPFDEMSDELHIDDNALWEGLTKARK